MRRAPVSYTARSLSRIVFLILMPALWNTWMQDKKLMSCFNLLASGRCLATMQSLKL